MKNNKPKINEENALLKSQLARTLADYDNLRKRIERERADLENLLKLRIILRLLGVVDNLRLAQNHLKDPGLAITLTELENILKDEGIVEIKLSAGDEFNPEVAEATEVVESEKENNKIVEVYLTGWRYEAGPVIRHAKVKVSRMKGKS